MTNDLSRANNAIINELVKKGAKHKQLPDTNLHIVQIGSKDYFFVHDMNLTVPYIYGVFASDKIYISAILRDEGIQHIDDIGTQAHKIILTRSGFFGATSPVAVNSLKGVKYIESTHKTGASTKKVAEQILSLFPRASYISFSLLADSIESTTIDELVIGDVSFLLDDFLDISLLKNKKHKNTVGVIVDMLLADS